MTSHDSATSEIRSAGEIQTVVRKAGIGAGLDAGPATELAAAIRWLTDHGYDGARIGCRVVGGEIDALRALSAVDAALASPGDQIALAGDEGAGVGVLILGLIGVSAEALKCAAEMMGDTWAVTVGSIDVEGQPGAGPFRLTVLPAGNASPATGRRVSPPVRIAAADWGLLNSFAARTYVPSSATSRARGAGAGLTDND